MKTTKIKCNILIILLILSFSFPNLNATISFPYIKPTSYSAVKKIWIFNSIILGSIVTYGTINWWKDYRKMWIADDGWFERNSDNGGADKLGHAYCGYLFSRIFTNVYCRLGMRRENAIWQGAVASWILMGILEVGDAFNQYGFSPKDIAANSIGVLIGYLQELSPVLDRLFDFRVEYIPSKGFLKSGETDVFTDYSGMKHVIVFKMSGIPQLKNTILSYLELHVGFFSRGYKGYDKEYYPRKVRCIYGGIGINISKILQKISRKSKTLSRPLSRGATLFRFYQLPHTYIKREKYFY